MFNHAFDELYKLFVFSDIQLLSPMTECAALEEDMGLGVREFGGLGGGVVGGVLTRRT